MEGRRVKVPPSPAPALPHNGAIPLEAQTLQLAKNDRIHSWHCPRGVNIFDPNEEELIPESER